MLGLGVSTVRRGEGGCWWSWRWRAWYNFLLKPGANNTRAPALARSSPGSRSLLPSFHLDRRRARLWCVSLNSHHYWPQTADTSRMTDGRPASRLHTSVTSVTHKSITKYWKVRGETGRLKSHLFCPCPVESIYSHPIDFCAFLSHQIQLPPDWNNKLG